jgi:hypothetical protein
MNLFMRLGAFLFFFGLLILSTKLLLSKKTQAELKRMDNTIPAYFRSSNKVLARMIIILVFLMMAVYIIIELS